MPIGRLKTRFCFRRPIGNVGYNARMIYHHIALNVPLAGGLLTYAHSEALSAGTRVAVRFVNKTVAGIVWQSGITPDIDPAKILPLQAVFAEEPPLPEAWRRLLAFAARYYHYPLGQAVAAALPQGLREARPVALPEPPLFYSLTEAGRLNAPPERHRKQYALWQAMCGGRLEMAALKKINPQAPKLIGQWQAQAWINADAAALPVLRPSEHILNEQQQAASAHIQAAFGRFQPFLLYGITGSGKTEVYFDAVAKVLAEGRQVLFLLPEINLTPQLLKRVQARFADVPTAVLHSQTAAGARTQDYLRAMLGQAKLIIGTRPS